MKLISLGRLDPPDKTEKRSVENVVASGNLNLLLMGGGDSPANEFVSPETALGISEVYSCVRVLSELISGIPLNLVQQTDSGDVVHNSHPIHEILSGAVNEETTSVVWLETSVTHLMTEGNAYSQIIRSVDGSQVLAIWNLHPNTVQVDRLPTGKLSYRVQDGSTQRVFSASDILHFKLNSWNGVLGLSPVRQCMRMLGSAIGVEKYSSRFFANNAMPAGVITAPENAKYKPEDKSKMRADWEAMHSASNQHRLAVLDQGMDYKPIATNPDQSQMVETRRFIREQVCSVFRIPPYLLGDTSKLTSGNLQELRQDLVTSVLKPLAKRFESELYLKILRPMDRTLRAAFDFSELVRGNQEQTATAVSLGRQWNVLTLDESRALLGFNPIGGELGKSLLSPTNMNVLDSKGSIPVPAPAPTEVINDN